MTDPIAESIADADGKLDISVACAPTTVRFEDVPGEIELYRVGHRTNSQGLWYDRDGNYTGNIHLLAEGAARALPMGPDPIFRDAGEKWISVTTSLVELRNWFSLTDIVELSELGYEVLVIRAAGYRTLHFPTYSHAVYAESQVMGVAALHPSDLYPVLVGDKK